MLLLLLFVCVSGQCAIHAHPDGQTHPTNRPNNQNRQSTRECKEGFCPQSDVCDVTFDAETYVLGTWYVGGTCMSMGVGIGGGVLSVCPRAPSKKKNTKRASGPFPPFKTFRTQPNPPHT